MSEGTRFDIEIEISEAGPVVRVKSTGTSSEDDYSTFDEAYLHARKLYSRISRLDEEAELLLKVENLQERTEHLWTTEGDTSKLGSVPKEAAARLALSLLRVYPSSSAESAIVKETGVPQMTANDNLRGKVKSSKAFFEGSSDGYRITKNGLEWLENTAIPALSEGNVRDTSNSS